MAQLVAEVRSALCRCSAFALVIEAARADITTSDHRPPGLEVAAILDPTGILRSSRRVICRSGCFGGRTRRTERHDRRSARCIRHDPCLFRAALSGRLLATCGRTLVRHDTRRRIRIAARVDRRCRRRDGTTEDIGCGSARLAELIGERGALDIWIGHHLVNAAIASFRRRGSVGRVHRSMKGTVPDGYAANCADKPYPSAQKGNIPPAAATRHHGVRLLRCDRLGADRPATIDDGLGHAIGPSPCARRRWTRCRSGHPGRCGEGPR